MNFNLCNSYAFFSHVWHNFTVLSCKALCRATWYVLQAERDILQRQHGQAAEDVYGALGEQTHALVHGLACARKCASIWMQL